MVSSKPTSTPAVGSSSKSTSGVLQHGPGDQQPLRLAAGHVSEILPQHAPVKTDQSELVVQMADKIRTGTPEAWRLQQKELHGGDRSRTVDRESLRDVADLDARPPAYRSRVGEESQQSPKQDSFAGAVGTNHRQGFALPHREGYVGRI